MADYTTRALLKSRLGINDTTDDTMLDAIITAVSRQIDDYCGRRFYAATETRYYTASHCGSLLVDDVLSVSSLQTDDDGDRTYENTWATTDYDLEPANAQLESQPQPYWRICITPNSNYGFPVGVSRGVKITGSFGFASSTPAVIAEACLHQSELTYRQKDNPYGAMSGEQFATRAPVGSGLHPFIRQMLMPYVKWNV